MWKIGTITYYKVRIPELFLHPGSIKVKCYESSVFSIYCNDELRVLKVFDNNTTYIMLNEDLEVLDCYRNKLTSLTCNKQLKELNCSFNELTELKLNDGLERLYCSNNKLTSIKYIPSTLKDICCYKNNFDFETLIRIYKWYLENEKRNALSLSEKNNEIDDYKKYLVLLLGFKDTHILKYIGDTFIEEAFAGGEEEEEEDDF
jgi:Leucine-rich repeat (LRR) protein